MKKKIIVIISIVVIIAISVFIIMEVMKHHTFEATITNCGAYFIWIESDTRIIPYEDYIIRKTKLEVPEYAFGRQIHKDGKVYVALKYEIALNDVMIKNEKGKKISISDLKQGDMVKVTIKDGLDGKGRDALGRIVPKLYDVKEIRIIQK